MSDYELIDRYLAEVGKNLPRKNRGDIEAEIRSAIEDALAERSEKAGRPVDEAMVVDILKDYGAPRKVASSYQPERYVIGPQLFPSFLTVVQVVLPIVMAVALVKLGISLNQILPTFRNIFITVSWALAGFIGNALVVLGGIMVLFAAVQWSLPQFRERASEWEPSKLSAATPRNRVDLAAALLKIICAGLAIVIFNFYPEKINMGYYPNGNWWIAFFATTEGAAWSTTILSDAFFGYLPALTTLWALTVLLNMALIGRGRWETWSRWARFGLDAATTVLATMMITGPGLVAVSAAALTAAGFPNPQAGMLFIDFAKQGTFLILAAVILACLVRAIRLIIHLTGRNLPPRLERFAHP